MRMIFSRDLWPCSSTDPAFGDFQFFGQKTTQRGIRFSLHCRSAELDLYRPSMFAHDAVDLRIWHDVKPKSSHRFHGSGISILDPVSESDERTRQMPICATNRVDKIQSPDSLPYNPTASRTRFITSSATSLARCAPRARTLSMYDLSARISSRRLRIGAKYSQSFSKSCSLKSP
jgi:hypothetical protein